MSHKAVLSLIESTVKKIQDDIKFFYGPEQYFNEEELNAFTFCNLAPLNSSPQYSVNNTYNYTKVWSIQMVFYRHDDKGKRKYAEILDITDNLVDRFINTLNQQDGIVITGINSTPVIEVLANILTGHLLTLSILVPDNYDYCGDC